MGSVAGEVGGSVRRMDLTSSSCAQALAAQSGVWDLASVTRVGIVVVVIAVVTFFWICNRRHRNPKIRGPALTGTAQVLSVKKTYNWAGNFALNHKEFFETYFGGEDFDKTFQMELRVEVPGRQPYDVTVKRDFAQIRTGRLRPGETFPVEVDPTNPQKIRI